MVDGEIFMLWLMVQFLCCGGWCSFYAVVDGAFVHAVVDGAFLFFG